VGSAPPQNLPIGTLDTISPGGPWLVYTFRRNRNALDVVFRPSVSSDLIHWNPINDEGQIVNPDPDGDASAELRSLRISANSNEPRRFVRLGVGWK